MSNYLRSNQAVRSRSSDNVSSSRHLGLEAPVWLPDSCSNACLVCHRKFSLLVRRHHCRCCGTLLCSSCSTYFVPLKYLNWQVARVCQFCSQILNQPSHIARQQTSHRRSNSLSSLATQEEIISKLVRDIQIKYLNENSRDMANLHNHSVIDTLPREILSKIVSYVGYSDKRVCRYVNQSWNQMLATTTFYHDTNVHLTNLTKQKLKEVLEETYEDTCFQHFLFEKCTISVNTSFWSAMAQGIKSLELIGCEITERELVSILLLTCNLETLVLADCRDLFMSGTLFSNEEERLKVEEKLIFLQNLNLSNNKYLSDVLLIKITKTTPNLRELKISGCNIMNDAGVYRKFYPESQDIQASPSVLTWRTVVNVVSSLSNTIRCLDVSFNTGVDLELLANVPQLNLEQVNLAGCGSVTNRGVISLVTACPHISKLDLSMCRRVFTGLPESVTDIFKVLSANNKLKELKMNTISTSRLEPLSLITSLHSLEMNNLDTPGNEVCSSLEKLDVTVLTKLTLRNLAVPASLIERVLKDKKFPCLTELDLSCGGETITNNLLSSICRNMTQLTSLCLHNNPGITDAGVLGICESNAAPTSLAQLKEQLANNNKILLGSRSEQEIKLASVAKKMTADTIDAQTSFNSGLYLLRKLKNLDLSHTSITGLSLKLGIHAPDLRKLNVENSTEIEDSALYDFAIRHPRLEHLNIGYTSLSDTSLISCLSCLPRLVHLDISSCKNLCNAGVRAICQISPQLERLVLSNCYNISMETARILETSLPNLSVVTLGLQGERFYEVGRGPAAPPPPPPPIYKN